MTRWRPPQPGSTPIISAAGHLNLKQELDQLWRVERPQVTAVVQAAAANGDRSENGDYIYGKRRLAEIDRRVRYLRRRLDGIKVVEGPPEDKSRIYFGARVVLADESEKTLCIQIMGPDEIDTRLGHISIDSPMARALLGKSCGDEVQVTTPTGNAVWWVEKIDYQPLGNALPA